MKKQYHWGWLTIAMTLLVTWTLWLGSMAYFDDWYEDRFKYAAKIGSMGTTMLMCWAFILSTRLRPVERLFGGLDKVYKAHRYVGEIAFGLIFLHPIFLAMHLLPDWREYLRFFWFSGDWVRNTGIIALIVFCALVALSLWVKIAYHRWKLTHNYFGALFLLVILHGFIAEGEIRQYPLLFAWFAAWAGVAMVCYCYIRFLYRSFGPLYEYRVEGKEKEHDVLHLKLQPVGRDMKFRSGQFLYISLDSSKVGGEPHPFSISSPPQADHLQISVKELGDWTTDLDDVEQGARARVWGPYGHFGRSAHEQPERDAVFVAGGIGVTPFLSLVTDQELMQRRIGQTFLIYSVIKKGEEVARDRLLQTEESFPRFKYIPHSSDEEGYLDAEALKEQVGELRGKVFFICGPKPMMDSLKQSLLDVGVPLEQVFTEDFSII